MKELKHIQLFEEHRKWVPSGHKKKPIYIDSFNVNPDIIIKVSKTDHAHNRKERHGADMIITDEEILGTVEAAADDIIQALLVDEIDILQRIDNRPLMNVKAGEPTRFIIRDLKTELHMVCEINPMPENYHSIEIIVVTVMREGEFKVLRNQLIIEIPAEKSAYPEDKDFYDDDNNALPGSY